ncbi:Cystathionine beta-synthase [hydrothermal vent metagenome]|uniref:Cystathionine beta-synthase n=1 Tax=hydrothermal vent metagenome TaxID=652676 RepID=A0A3B0RDR4_9ZZZZ
MTHPAKTVIDLIGNTPLIRLQQASEETGCEILGKAEFLNPGQSVKDRAALGMVMSARKSGALQANGTIVEGTAGNTGIGLAMVGAALGHKVVIVMPDNQAEEKKQAVRLFGAKLIEVPVVPPTNPEHFASYSKRLAEQLNASQPNGAWWANQFDNTDNRLAHYNSTAPEIIRQTDGKLDGFICAVGSGGTLGGISMFLKEKYPNIKIALADPMGAKLHNWYSKGELSAEGGSITEGIGQGRVTQNLAGVEVDMSFQIHDRTAVQILFDLVENEGLCLGGSSGINIAGAIQMAKQMGPGHTIVTLLCDYGNRYASKLYNPTFLRSKDLPVPNWLQDEAE